jgi:hypothetical protein
MSANSPPLHLLVFLASPGDVEDERNAARELMETALPKDPLLTCCVREPNRPDAARQSDDWLNTLPVRVAKWSRNASPSAKLR